jgi:hypothetical protein
MAYSILEHGLKYTIMISVLIFWVNDEQTGLHICAKKNCDRFRSFDIIDQKACRSYGEQDSSDYCFFQKKLQL